MKLSYVMLEVGGIQNYICRTGKLKEMIGGSEIIESISQDFYEGIRGKGLGLSPEYSPLEDTHGVLELQRNAGTLCLAMQPDMAKRFLNAFSMAALERFPGLPLFGASAPFIWSKDGLKEGRKAASAALGEQRGRVPVGSGLSTLPVVAVARLDGLPATGYDKDERISLPSSVRRSPDMLEKSRQRLQNIANPFAQEHGLTLCWEDDLTKLLGKEKENVALIHMDGNDLGKCFTAEIMAAEKLEPLEGVRRLQKLSELVSLANETAFRKALEQALLCELHDPNKVGTTLSVPLRPLVLGGDDITVIVRADLALPFIHQFVRTFEHVTAKAGKPLSLGVGMVVMPRTYPFVKAFSLVEDLLKSAKNATKNMQNRPSSLDYLVLTNDVETNLTTLRRRIYTAVDGSSLTTKPFVLTSGVLKLFCQNADSVLRQLPRSHTRPAMNACRQGQNAARREWEKLRENLYRGLGGRHGKDAMSVAQLEHLFSDGFFEKQRTALGDYLELEHLLPAASDVRDHVLTVLAESACPSEAPHA